MQRFFSSPSHQSLKKQAVRHQAQRLSINIPSFHFLPCYLIKRSQSHDFLLSNSNLSEMISRGTLMTRSPPTFGLSAWLPEGWTESLSRECSWQTCPVQSLASLLIRLPTACRNVWHLCVSSPCSHWCPLLGFAISRSGLPTHLAKRWPLLLAYQPHSLGC